MEKIFEVLLFISAFSRFSRDKIIEKKLQILNYFAFFQNPVLSSKIKFSSFFSHTVLADRTEIFSQVVRLNWDVHIFLCSKSLSYQIWQP